MVNPFTAIRTYYSETVDELKKCTWPSKHELYEATTAVLSLLFILAVMIMVFDAAAQLFVRLITGMH